MLYRGPFAAQEKCGLKGGGWMVWSAMATAADALEKDLSDAAVETYFLSGLKSHSSNILADFSPWEKM